jgi:YVTN family beta-propeller protein
VSPDGAFLYVANQGSNDVFAYAINGTSGALAAVSGSPFPAGVTPRAIATPGRP